MNCEIIKSILDSGGVEMIKIYPGPSGLAK
jgi:hypothetical protein